MVMAAIVVVIVVVVCVTGGDMVSLSVHIVLTLLPLKHRVEEFDVLDSQP